MMRESKNRGADNVKVVVRVRPPLERQHQNDVFLSAVKVHPSHRQIQLFQYFNLDSNAPPENAQEYIDNPNNYSKHEYTFDYVYDDDATQQEVYDNTAKISVDSALEGYNATIFAYGQTGTGKTFTMEGFRYDMLDEERGIVPRAIEDIFRYIEQCEDPNTKFMVRASYIQIYNEVIGDLLRNEKKNLQIRQQPRKGVYVEGASEWAVVRPGQIVELMKKGAKSRATAKTNMNESSSRSHAIFIITIEQMSRIAHDVQGNQGRQLKVAKLNLVDLAGSERVRVTGASGKRLDQCKNINLSLSCLGMVIAALTEDKPQSHIPYRNSVLTRLLSDSLGGNCRTTMLTMISPAPEAFQESLSSLKFAHRAKTIRNTPLVNEDLDQKALIRKYETELSRLRSELNEQNKVLIDKSKLIQLEREKRQIEEDKRKAIMALNERSNEFFKEREQKKLLEEKIKAFNSQLIQGGVHPLEQLNEQTKIIKEYQAKIKSLEKGQKGADGQVDKELFQKQNELLMSLAVRLYERDEVNTHLNEELCAYDRITKESEQALERKSRRIEKLQALLVKHRIQIPPEDWSDLTMRQPEQRADGVLIEGEMTYNVTEKNLKKASQEINALKEVNGQQKQQIVRLKEELMKKPAPTGKASPEGYRAIRESVNTIVRGLTKKENTDMKTIINEIYKIKQIAEDGIHQ